MTDKQINKWLRRQFAQVGWVLVAYYFLLNILALLAMALEAGRQALWAIAVNGNPFDMDLDAIAGNAWGYVMTLVVGLVILQAWKGRDYWKTEILVRGEGSMGVGSFVCLLIFCMGAQMVNGFWVGGLELILNQFGLSVMTIAESVSGSSDTFSMFLYTAILAPFAEEILFRGYVLRALRPYGKRFAIFASAVLFGLFHGNLMQTPYAILMGLLLGYVTVEYSICWAVALHMFNNLVLADLLTRLTVNWTDMAYSMLNMVLFGGSLLISLVILVQKRYQIRQYRSEYMDRRVLKWFFLNSGVLALSALALVNMISLLFV